MKQVYVGLFAFLFTAGTASGAVINVPGDQPTVQAGIDAAGPGDTVLVAPGTYAENLVIGKGNLHLQGSGAAATILDGGGAGRVIRIDRQSTVEIDGFTIRNGAGTGDDFDGGGILVDYSAAINIHDNVITQNQVAGYNADGGGVTIQGCTAPIVLFNNVIRDNTAENWGGGLCIQNTAGARIERNDISRNNAAVGDGVSLYAGLSPASGTFVNNRISGNFGAGIYVDDGCFPTIGGAADEANALYGNTDYAVINRSGGTITATYNYWGATTESAIRAAIYDDLDEPGVGTVDYSPWVGKDQAPMDLSVDLADAPDTVLKGETLTYTITVRNLGPSNVPAVTVTDTLPASAAFVSAVSTQGACNQVAGVVTCAIGAMASGAQVTVTTVVTAPDAAIALTNTAVVAGLGHDLDSANDTAQIRTAIGHMPVPGTLSPSAQTSSANTAQIFSAVYEDADGWQNLETVDIRVNAANSGAGAIWARYVRSRNKLFLFNDAGTALLKTNCAPGSSRTIENSQGVMDCANTSVTAAGNDLTVDWSIAPKAAFAGARRMFLIARDRAGFTSGWRRMGDWTINP